MRYTQRLPELQLMPNPRRSRHAQRSAKDQLRPRPRTFAVAQDLGSLLDAEKHLVARVDRLIDANAIGQPADDALRLLAGLALLGGHVRGARAWVGSRLSLRPKLIHRRGDLLHLVRRGAIALGITG